MCLCRPNRKKAGDQSATNRMSDRKINTPVTGFRSVVSSAWVNCFSRNSVEKSPHRIHKLRRQLVGLARYDATIARIRPIYNNACVTGSYSQPRRLRMRRWSILRWARPGTVSPRLQSKSTDTSFAPSSTRALRCRRLSSPQPRAPASRCASISPIWAAVYFARKPGQGASQILRGLRHDAPWTRNAWSFAVALLRDLD